MPRFLSFLTSCCIAAPALGQLRVVNYNTLDGPTPGVHDNSANMQTIFGAMATQSVNGVAKRPDLIILQEQTNTSAAALAALLNTQFGLTNAYVAITPAGQPSSSDPVFIDRQSFVYDTTSLQLIGSGTSIATGAHRPVIRAQFRPAGYTVNSASFYAYGAHLMSSSAPDRDLQTAAMRANSNALGEVHAIYAGDFNMQNNQETGWQNLAAGAGAGLAIDPLNPNNVSQTWNNNSAFAPIHTQSTRTGATPDADGGATGGMDDRFDVQISTQEFHDGEGLSYISGSYRAFGQDGQHFNAAINSAPFPLGSTVANALWDASDHLPVVVDYQLPAKGALTQAIAAPAVVIVGAISQATFNVRNTAPTSVAVGADELDYTFSTSGSVTVSFNGTTPAAAVGNNHVVTFDTSTAGNKNIVTQLTTTSDGAPLTGSLFQASTKVVTHAVPSFDPSQTAGIRNIDFGIFGQGMTAPELQVLLHNRVDVAGFTAALDLDGLSGEGDTGAIALAMPTGGLSIAAGASRSGSLAFSSTNLGVFSAVFTLSTSDENIPGATSLAELTLNVIGRIALPGDADLSNAVDIGDFAVLAGNFNEASQVWQDGDFNRDSIVDIGDFSILAANFNQSAADRPRTNVPEPSGFAAVLAVFLRYAEGPCRLRTRRR